MSAPSVFNRTGTLTGGGAELNHTAVGPRQDAAQALQLLASLEQASHHLLAESIVRPRPCRRARTFASSRRARIRGSG